MIAIGSDHGGFDLKQTVIAHLKERGFEVINMDLIAGLPHVIILFTDVRLRRLSQAVSVTEE